MGASVSAHPAGIGAEPGPTVAPGWEKSSFGLDAHLSSPPLCPAASGAQGTPGAAFRKGSGSSQHFCRQPPLQAYEQWLTAPSFAPG